MPVSVSGYELGRVLGQSRGTRVYEAIRKADGLEVIVKLYAPNEPAADDRYEYEYALLRSLNVRGVVQAVDLLRSGQQIVLVLERSPGIGLGDYAGGRPLDLETFLGLAVQIAAILRDVHEGQVVHRDLKPASFVVSPGTLEVRLVDLGISVALERTHGEIYDPDVLAGTLPYLSPEQTGRRTGNVDRRSDLYALGAIFYELLSGRPPFEAADPLGLVHAHLARTPVRLDLRSSEIPEVLANIVGRLLAKDPVDRYQSAASLWRDLERCGKECSGSEIASFAIGDDDLFEHLGISARVYGRERERAKMKEALEASRHGPELLLFHGAAGIGKTALIQEIQAPLASQHGYFVAGEFEHSRSSTPLLGLVRALDSLVDRLLVESDAQLEHWKSHLLAALGSQAPALVSILPNLARILGPQQSPTELGAIESQNRLQGAVTRFLCAIASQENPLVLFLDDLQWGDPGSLAVLSHLARHDAAVGLLILGAYRADEIDIDHPLQQVLRLVEPDSDLELHPLSDPAVVTFFADTLRLDSDRAKVLATALSGRTQNNPLLLRQQLHLLVREGALQHGAQGWTWSEEAIRSVGIPEDALGMVEAKLVRLASELRVLLGAAACVGLHFDVQSLAAALGSRAVVLFPRLMDLVDEGLLATSGRDFRFTHEQIQQAARTEVGPELEQKYHERVGRLQRSVTSDAELPDRVFEIVGHLNWTLESESDPEHCLDLARLNLMAGEAAIRAGGYATGERVLVAGLRAFARAESPVHNRELGLSLRIQQFRCLSLSGSHERATAGFEALLGETSDPLEYCRICLAGLETSAAAARPEQAIRFGLQGLGVLGLRVPRKSSKLELLVLLARLRWAFRATARQRLRALPPCTDPLALMRVRLLAGCVPVAALGDTLIAELICVAALQTLKSGRSPETSFVFALAAVLIGSTGDPRGAVELADLVNTWIRDPSGPGRAPPSMMIHGTVLHRARPYRDCLRGLELAYELAQDEGNAEYSVYGLTFRAFFESAMGVPLDVVARTLRKGSGMARERGLTTYLGSLESGTRATQTLTGSKEPLPDPSSVPEPPMPRAIGATWSMQALVLLGKHELALAESDTVASDARLGLLGQVFEVEYFFYRGMAAAGCHGAEKRRPRRLLRVLAKSRRKLVRWARRNPASLGHKVSLLEAEIARTRGRDLVALELYERAAREAQADGFPHLEALSRERLGCFALELGLGSMSRPSLARARELYADWGAHAKADLMLEEFPQLAAPVLGGSDALPLPAKGVSGGHPGSPMATALDLASVLKSTRGIAEAAGHADIAARLIAGAIENAGAQRGVLIQRIDDALVLQVERDTEGDTGRVAGLLPLSYARALLPVELVRRVARTGEARVVADAQQDRELVLDPFVRESQVHAIACVPILSHGQISGVLYLENCLAGGLFTHDRVEVLEHLASQAAISLENARLSDALLGGEAQWQSLVEHAADNIAIVDSRRCIEFTNGRISSLETPDLKGQKATQLFAVEDRERVAEAVEYVFETGGHASFEARVLTAESKMQRWTTRVGPILHLGKVHRVTLVSTDVTEQKKLETQLRQSQKMEAIGTLAGGVAHDFNNLITVIASSSELGLVGLVPAQEALQEVAAAAERATSLTRKLLAFSRKQVLQPRVIDLNESVAETSKLLARVIGEDIELVNELAPELGPVRVDPGQFEQLVLNLVVNARDAMPQGGQIWLATVQVEVGEAESVHLEIEPGPYVVFSVRDVGIGMDEETRQRIFDPFFTTKPVGKGTGLGLATVHGIVRQSGGQINVESSPGAGTTFSVYLPVAQAAPERDVTRPPTVVPGGDETILIVEDDASVRRLAGRILSAQGYTVVEAGDGKEALIRARETRQLDLLLMDIVLPGPTGREVAAALVELHPTTKVLYTSGHADDMILSHGADAGIPFLEKPYNRDSLARRVREVLDQS